MKPVELGWTDHDGDHGHIIVGDVTDYAGPVQPDTIAIIEARGKGERAWTPVYLPRDIAETLHDALGRALADAVAGEFARYVPPAQHKFSCDVSLYGPDAKCNCGLPERT